MNSTQTNDSLQTVDPAAAPVGRAKRVGAKVATVGVGALLAAGVSMAAAAPAHAASTVWDRVAACESSGNWSINTGNGYYGGLQFSEATWLGYGGATYAQYANQATKAQQIAIAQRVLASQGPGAWPVCSVQAGLTKANGGANSSASASGSTSTSSSSTSTTSTSTSTSSTSTGSSSAATSTKTPAQGTTHPTKTVTIKKSAPKKAIHKPAAKGGPGSHGHRPC